MKTIIVLLAVVFAVALQQLQSEQLQGPIEFLSEAEGRGATKMNQGTMERPWELWKKQLAEK